MDPAVAQTRLKPRVPAARLPLPSVGRGAATMGVRRTGGSGCRKARHPPVEDGMAAHVNSHQPGRDRVRPRPDPSGPPSGAATCVDPPERRGGHAGHRAVHERRPVAQRSAPPELAGQVHTVASEDDTLPPGAGGNPTRRDVSLFGRHNPSKVTLKVTSMVTMGRWSGPPRSSSQPDALDQDSEPLDPAVHIP